MVLDTKLTDALIEEGYAREFISKVQSMRKDTGFDVTDHIAVTCQCGEKLAAALDKARDAYEDAHKRLCTGNDNIIRVGERLRKTARLQTKRQHAARTLEIAGSDADSDDRSEAPAALPDSGA